MEERAIIVGMPVHNGLEYLKLAVDSLINSTDTIFTLLIVESESTDGSAEFVDILPSLYPKNYFKIIHTKKEGPLKAYNKLFEIAKQEKADLYLTQTDAIHFRLYKRDWLRENYEYGKNIMIGMIAPFGAWGYTEIARPKIDWFKWVGGWASYIPYRIIEEFGGYDENYEQGDKVDIDYCYNLINNGYYILEANYYVQHHWMTEHAHENLEEIKQIKDRTTKYFRNKYNLEVTPLAGQINQ